MLSLACFEPLSRSTYFSWLVGLGTLYNEASTHGLGEEILLKYRRSYSLGTNGRELDWSLQLGPSGISLVFILHFAFLIYLLGPFLSFMSCCFYYNSWMLIDVNSWWDKFTCVLEKVLFCICRLTKIGDSGLRSSLPRAALWMRWGLNPPYPSFLIWFKL